MSMVQGTQKCEQCSFPDADYLFDCGSSEWCVWCRRCGYYADWKHESCFSNGHLEKGVRTIIFSAGSFYAISAKTGVAQHSGLPETEVEKVAAKMREEIASGKLSPASFVTRYDFKSRQVTALVGQVPLASPCPEEPKGAIDAAQQQSDLPDLPDLE